MIVPSFVVVAACGGTHPAAPDAQPDAPPDASPVGVRHVPLTGCNYSYTGEFTLGGTPFRLMVDTGSNVLGVAAVGCDSCTLQGVAPLYTPGPTAMDQDQQGSASYGGGELGYSGEIYKDVVGASTLPSVELDLIAITSQTDFFFKDQCGDAQGIIGLDEVLDPEGRPTNYLHELVAAGATDELAIRYCLGNGDLWLDGYDPAATTGDPQWVAMSQNGNYTVSLADIAVAGTSIGLPPSTYGPALLDSGGPNLLLPPAAFTAITTSIAASPAFAAKFGDATWFKDTGNCTTLAETRAQLDAELPPLTVTIGSPAISVELPATAAYLQAFTTPTGTQYCQAMFSFTQFTDLGNTLMRAGLVIHDRAHSQLGFAPAPACVDTASIVETPPDLAAIARITVRRAERASAARR